MDKSAEASPRRHQQQLHGGYRQAPPEGRHHHHHHFHVSPHCPLHNYMLYSSNNHSPKCPLFSSHPQALSSFPPQNVQNLSLPLPVESSTDDVPLMQEGGGEWEEEEDPVFVLTDEWREFFAKSEAKRKLAKKQAKLKGNGKET